LTLVCNAKDDWEGKDRVRSPCGIQPVGVGHLYNRQCVRVLGMVLIAGGIIYKAEKVPDLSAGVWLNGWGAGCPSHACARGFVAVVSPRRRRSLCRKIL